MSKSGRTMSMSALIPPELQELVSRLGQVSARQAEVAAPMVEEALRGRAPQYVPGMSVPERVARGMVGQQAAEGIPRSPESTMTSGLAMLLPFLSTGLPTGRGTGIFDLFRNLIEPQRQQVYTGEQGEPQNVDYYAGYVLDENGNPRVPLAEQNPNLTGRYPAGLPTGPLTSTGTETTPAAPSTAINPETGLREGDRVVESGGSLDGYGYPPYIYRGNSIVGEMGQNGPVYYTATSGPGATTGPAGGPAPAPTGGPTGGGLVAGGPPAPGGTTPPTTAPPTAGPAQPPPTTTTEGGTTTPPPGGGPGPAVNPWGGPAGRLPPEHTWKRKILLGNEAPATGNFPKFPPPAGTTLPQPGGLQSSTSGFPSLSGLDTGQLDIVGRAAAAMGIPPELVSSAYNTGVYQPPGGGPRRGVSAFIPGQAPVEPGTNIGITNYERAAVSNFLGQQAPERIPVELFNQVFGSGNLDPNTIGGPIRSGLIPISGTAPTTAETIVPSFPPVELSRTTSGIGQAKGPAPFAPPPPPPPMMYSAKGK